MYGMCCVQMMCCVVVLFVCCWLCIIMCDNGCISVCVVLNVFFFICNRGFRNMMVKKMQLCVGKYLFCTKKCIAKVVV